MDEGAIIVGSLIGLTITIGLAIGIYAERASYQKDTYDCTVKCPQMVHSISYNGVCYCETK